MPDKSARIARNLELVRERMAGACQKSGRPIESVRLIAVTKYVGVEEIAILKQLGHRDMGESRVQDARPKIDAFGDAVQWHMIGTVQRRKARDVAELFDYVDSVDRVELAVELDKRCRAAGKVMPVLLEVNVSGEDTKHGFPPDELGRTFEAIHPLEHLEVRGLMTMAPHVDDPEDTRPVFARLRTLTDALGLEECSMGMTNDYTVAIEEGATQVRIGSALFQSE